MYSNTTLYYLNQIGIRPWVMRDRSISEVDCAIQQEKFKLLVFIASNLSIKAQSLLKQMMAYINLCEQELAIIPVQENESFSNYNSHIKQKKPLAILFLGPNHRNEETYLNSDCPVFVSTDPEYLLVHPVEKRKVFNELSSIRQLFV